jgi:DNA-binding PadR family transcriptional regulator
VSRIVSEPGARVLSYFLTEPGKARYARDILIAAELKSGALYPMLRRFEQRGVLEAQWESLDVATREGRQPRVEYQLSDDGSNARALLAEREAVVAERRDAHREPSRPDRRSPRKVRPAPKPRPAT